MPNLMITKSHTGTAYTTSTTGVTGDIPDNAVFALLRIWNGYNIYEGTTFIPLGWMSSGDINITFRVEYNTGIGEIIINPSTKRYTLRRLTESTFPVLVSFF